MKLGVVLRLWLGKEMTQENCEKVIADLIARFKKDDPNLTGQKWVIDLGENGFGVGMFLGFSKSVFVSEIIKQEFPQINVYYMQLIKQANEKELFEKFKDKSKSQPASFGSNTF